MPVPTSITSAPHRDMDLELVSGAWPDGLAGELVVSAPRVEPGLPYALFGFGTLCRLSLRPGTHGAAPGRFAWRTAVIDSPSERLHRAHPEAFRAGPTGYTSPFGVPNAANTAPLPWGERLFATWDVGRPMEVDPHGLGFLGEVGHIDTWGGPTMDLGGVLPFMFSSAHPVVDAERDCLWTVKLDLDLADGSQQLNLVRWDGTDDGRSGGLRTWPVEGGRVLGGSHTISQTERFVVLADSGNFKSDAGEMSGGPRTATIDRDAAVYVLRKDEIEATPPGEPLIPTCFRVAPTTGHFYACWDDSDGIRVLFEHMDLMDLGYRLEPGDRDAHGNPVDPALVGFYNTAMAPNSCSEVVLDTRTGTATQIALLREEWTWNLELSAMDWSADAQRSPSLHHIAYQGFRPGAVTHRAIENYGDRVGPLPGHDTPGVLATLQRGTLEVVGRHDFTDTADHITSPAFAPRPPEDTAPDEVGYTGADPGGHDGWVVLPVLNDAGFRVEVFDAARVADGPVATLAAPGGECVPVVLHSAWMPTVAAPVEAERLCFADEVHENRLARLETDHADSVRAVAAELG